MPSSSDCYLRSPDGWSRRIADVAESGLGRLRYSDEKKASIAAPYIGQQMTYDVLISLADPKAAFDLEKERTITVTFVLNRIGGCILPYAGDQGTVS